MILSSIIPPKSHIFQPCREKILHQNHTKITLGNNKPPKFDFFDPFLFLSFFLSFFLFFSFFLPVLGVHDGIHAKRGEEETELKKRRKFSNQIHTREKFFFLLFSFSFLMVVLSREEGTHMCVTNPKGGVSCGQPPSSVCLGGSCQGVLRKMRIWVENGVKKKNIIHGA